LSGKRISEAKKEGLYRKGSISKGVAWVFFHHEAKRRGGKNQKTLEQLMSEKGKGDCEKDYKGMGGADREQQVGGNNGPTKRLKASSLQHRG